MITITYTSLCHGGGLSNAALGLPEGKPLQKPWERIKIGGEKWRRVLLSNSQVCVQSCQRDAMQSRV